MDRSFDVDLLRNVQATGGKSSVSKEFVGLRKKREKNRAKRDAASGYSQKGAKGCRNEPSGSDEEEETKGRIDITI